jgi:pimeloyl-ACP methyl ester carboxylesterase
MQREDRTIGDGDDQIATRDWGGSGPPMVLMPGGGRNLADWEPVVPHLLEHHRLVGVDTPGHGGSSEPARWDWDLAVRFVELAADALALDNPFVVGHSLGGMVAARYGVAHPDAPGVVNVDGHGLGGPSVPPGFHEERARLMEHMPEPPADAGDDAWLETQLEMMRPLVEARGLSWDRARPAMLRSYAKDADDRTWRRRPSNAFIQSLPDDMGPELFDVYRAVKCPLLVFNCTGNDAMGFSAETAAAYRASIASDLDQLRTDRPSVKVATIDCGHMALLEAPEETAAHLVAFTSAAQAQT